MAAELARLADEFRANHLNFRTDCRVYLAMFFGEVRHAFRMLAKNPAFTTVAALSLALGIGTNTALFSFHDALLFRPLPVREPGSVVAVTATSPEDGALSGGGLSYPNYRDLREKGRSFDGLVAQQLSTFGFARSRQDVREMRLGVLVSDNFFNVLGIEPGMGRSFTQDEGQVLGRGTVVILANDFWKSTLGGDRSILDRGSVVINGIDFTVIGIAPESFTGLDVDLRPAFYIPAMMAERIGIFSPTARAETRINPVEDRGARAFVVKGRLKSGVSRQQAQAELTTIWKSLEQQYPDTNRNQTLAVRTELQERVRRQPPTALIVAMMTALAGLVLFIACANVANLMLGRARARSREIAIRLALGVSRARLLRQLMTESFLLASVGGALGEGFAYAGIRFFRSFQIPTDLPVVIATELDSRVLFFSLGAAAVSALLFGIAPARQSLKTDLVPALKSAELGQATRQRTFGRNVLVVVQVALSMVLLVATGMLLEGFRSSLVRNPGFRTDRLIMMSTDTSLVRYTPAQTHNFYRDLVSRMRSVPGVASVALTSSIPFNPPFANEVVIPQDYQFPRGQESVSVFTAAVDDHYFNTMKTDVVAGRAFTADDKDGSRLVAIVNQEFAKTYWPNQDPVGKLLRLTDARGPLLEVVGLARTGKYLFIGEPPMPFLYLPFAQHETTRVSVLAESTDPDPAPLANPLRDVVRTLDENQPVFNLRTFSNFYEQRAIGPQLLVMQVTAAMSVVGLSLALIGLYALVAYSVARRTREIGIRMAIGARRSDVLQMVLRQGFTLAAIGILVGGAASVAVARLLAAGMAGLGAPSSAAYVVVPIALMLLTLAASYFPARRASRVDPLRALRHD
jgi:putative ABC transport system permease protein